MPEILEVNDKPVDVNVESWCASSTRSSDLDSEFGRVDRTLPNGGVVAWTQVLGSWCLVVSTFGVSTSVGTLQAWLKQNTLSDYDSSRIGWMFSAQVFLMYFGGIQTGPIFDAYGCRVLLVPGSIAWCAAILILSWCKKYYQFVLCYSILGGLGSAMIFNPSIAVLTHWFSSRRSIAISIAATGSGIGGIMFPKMLNKMLYSHGYGWAVRTMAFMVIFLMAVANLLLRDRETRRSLDWREAIPNLGALRRKEFAACVVGLFMCEWAIFVPTQYIVSYAEERGFSPTYGSDLLAYMSAASTVSRVLSGIAASYVGNFNIMCVGAFLSGLLCLVVWLPAGSSQAGLTTFCVLFGASGGAVVAMTLSVIPVLAQVRTSGRYFGTAYLIASFAVLTGIPIGGAPTLEKHNYLGLILFTAIVYFLGSISFFVSRYWAVGLQPAF